jgi:hypothetical protein
MKEQTVYNAEDGGVRSDSESQGQNGGAGEARTFPKVSNSVPEIVTNRHTSQRCTQLPNQESAKTPNKTNKAHDKLYGEVSGFGIDSIYSRTKPGVAGINQSLVWIF